MRLAAIDPGIDDPSETFQTLWWSGAGFLLGDLPPEKKSQLDPGLRYMAEEGKAIPLKKYLEATAARGAKVLRCRAQVAYAKLRIRPPRRAA